MDEEYTESVDTSSDMDVSDVDVADDVPADIPDDIPEDVPEDTSSYMDMADDLTEDVSDDEFDDSRDYDESDGLIYEDSVEPADEELDDIPEDTYEDSDETAEVESDIDDIPEDTDDNPSDSDDGFSDIDESDIPEDTDEVSDQEADAFYEEDIPEDVTDSETIESGDAETADTSEQPEDETDVETSDVENSGTAEQPEDMSGAEATNDASDVENVNTTEQPQDMTDTETTDETADVADTDTAEQPEDMSGAEATNDASDVENANTTEQPQDVTDTETTDEPSEVEDTDTAEQPEDISDVKTANETTDIEDTDTTEQLTNVSDAETTDKTSDAVDSDTGKQPKDVTKFESTDGAIDAGNSGHGDLETYNYEKSSETPEINSISDYMNAHNYGPDDFAAYSQDPQWRQLIRLEYPDYALPVMTQDNANALLSQYMNDHNYGVNDYAEYSQDPIWRELHSTAFPDDELPPLDDVRQEQKKPSIAPSGGDNPPPPGGPNDEGGNLHPPDGSHLVCPVCEQDPCVCGTKDGGSDVPTPPDDPNKVLKRNELDLLKSGNNTINQRLEDKADDYRDKGLSEDEIAERLAADKWEYQKEFLGDAFPDEDVSPNVFNGFNEHGATDQIDEMEKSPFLPEIFSGKKSDDSIDLGHDEVDDKAREYNRTLKEFCESNGYVKNADFSDFDPHVAFDLVTSVVDAKKDFPDLEVNYLGSIGHQVEGLHDTVAAVQFDFYKQNGFDEKLAQQMAKKYADDFISNSKLDDTEGTYAWSLRTCNPSLDKYDGVAVNNDYAQNYAKFKSEKQADEIAKWAPIGCGSPKAVVDHELGHEIDNLLGASNDHIINDLYSGMMRDNKAETALSGYSKTNVKEFIAEAYSEYRNNPKPREVSRAVYNRLIELRDQKALARRLIQNG